MTKSDAGRNFLAQNYNKYRLEIFYDEDNAPHLNICEIEGNDEEFTIRSVKSLNMVDIFEQVAKHFSKIS